jgi:hypothetical protein
LRKQSLKSERKRKGIFQMNETPVPTSLPDETRLAATPGERDKFVAMVTAKAELDLKLTDYEPVSMLTVETHEPHMPFVPAIDYHNHLDSLDPYDVLRIMDACGVERVINITMQVGDEALRQLHRYAEASPGRFATIGWMDWSDAQAPDFIQRSLDRMERLVDHGAVGIKFWKDLGLHVRDASGELLRIDD